ncbi:hypothetical protein [Avibacterium sp. 20-129]|uniref:hypothetical protein n=1 Tax=Avibacterium sp. 20-129 TaxID=2911525 RepID=UPI00224651A9|nr:hypothetical protein [Avibacterium sp. 20-129]MCW9698346.1 hypothetical protein [Avibacterium sp. 20-129]
MRKSIKFSFIALCISNAIAVNGAFATESNTATAPLSKQQFLTEINKLNNEIVAKEKATEGLSQQINTLQSQITQAKQDLARQRSERDTLNNSLQASNSEKAKLEAKIQSLNTQLADLKKNTDPNIANLIKQKDSAEARLQQVKAEVQNKTAQLNKLNEQIKQSTATVAQFKTKIKPLETQLSGLNTQLQQQQNKLNQITAERKTVADKIAQYNKDREWVKKYELDSDGVRWRDIHFEYSTPVSTAGKHSARTSGNSMHRHLESASDGLGNPQVISRPVPTLPLSQYKPDPTKINEVLISSEIPENKGKAVGKVFFVNQHYSSYVAWQPINAIVDDYIGSDDMHEVLSLLEYDSDKFTTAIVRTDYQKETSIREQAQQRYDAVKAKTPVITYRGQMINVGGKSGDITLTADLNNNAINGKITNRTVNPVQDSRDLFLKNGVISIDRNGISFSGKSGRSIVPATNNPNNLPLSGANFYGTFAGKNMEEVVGRIEGLPNESDSVFGGTQVTK